MMKKTNDFINGDITFKIQENVVVGCYEITGSKDYKMYFCFTRKPNFINRLFCKWCLGWTWEDK